MKNLWNMFRAWLHRLFYPLDDAPVFFPERKKPKQSLMEALRGRPRPQKRIRPCKHYRHLSSGNGMNRWPAGAQRHQQEKWI